MIYLSPCVCIQIMKLSNSLFLSLPFLALFSGASGELQERALTLRNVAVSLRTTIRTLNKLEHIPEPPSPPTLDVFDPQLDYDTPDLGSLGSELDPNRVANYSIKSISPYLTSKGATYFRANPFAFNVNFLQWTATDRTDAELKKIIRIPLITATVTTTLTTRVSSTASSITLAPSLISKASSLISAATATATASSSLLQDAVVDNLFHLASVLSASSALTAPASNPTKVIKITFPANEVWPRRTATLTVRNFPTAK